MTRRWLRFLAMLIITGVVLVPVAAVVFLSLRPRVASGSSAAFGLANFTHVFAETQTLTWLLNSEPLLIVPLSSEPCYTLQYNYKATE